MARTGLNQPARTQTRYLTEILVEAGVVTPEQVDEALKRQRETGLRTGETLVELGIATEVDIGWALSRQLGLTFVDLDIESLDRDLVASFPVELLRRLEAVPLIRSGSMVLVALADPIDRDAVAQLEQAAGATVQVSVSTPTAIHAVLDALMGPPALPVARAGSAVTGHSRVVWERTGASFLSFQIAHACRAGATEIHFVPEGPELRIYHRNGADLNLAANEPDSLLPILLSHIEAMGGPVLGSAGAIHRAGRMTCPIGSTEVMVDVSLVAHGGSVAVALALHPAPAPPASLEAIGLDGVDLARLRGVLDRVSGLFMVSGPPRSGRSTALAALVAEAGTDRRRVLMFAPNVPAPAGALRTNLAGGAAMPAWEAIAVGQQADMVVFDDVLAGDAVATVGSPACHGRLTLAGTDWPDSFALLEWLAANVRTRHAVADRLQAVVQVRRAATNAFAEVVFATDRLRDALRAGSGATTLRAIALADGYRSLEDRVRAAVAAQLMSPADGARVLG
jgi:type IV pilus assembly protein PilB